MKRIVLRQPAGTAPVRDADISGDQTLQLLSGYFTNLRLINDVPFSYLVPEEELLPPESIRFFYLDENWLDALTDGALSIGRVDRLEAKTDQEFFDPLNRVATTQLTTPRYRKMHENHRRGECAGAVESEIRTGFLLRSGLVNQWKGLEAFGYCGNRQLEILRMEALTNEILFCIFDGELSKLVISQPKTGLRFGAPDKGGVITLREVRDTSDFGKPMDHLKVDLNAFAAPNGRLKVTELAKEMGAKLQSRVDSPQFAFELIAVAGRAEFRAKGAEL